MSRPIILSNGEMHVGINKYGLVHDLYFPWVGLENHAAGKSLRHHVGVWTDGGISWLDEDRGWQFSFSYPHYSLIGHTVAKHEGLGLVLEFDDMVDSSVNAFTRNIHVVNLQDRQRDVRLFMHQAFVIGDSHSNTDTGQYLPDSDAVLHYRGRRVFVASGSYDGKPFDQYTVGLFGIENHEGTYRDADDGELSFCNVEHGRVDSTLRFKLDIAANSSARVHYWLTAGKSMREAIQIHKRLQQSGLDEPMHATATWWERWMKPTLKAAAKLDAPLQDLFIKSAMIIKSQIDNRGAVIASTDSTMLNYDRDAYAYCWPRDGAYALWPLIRLGYTEEPLRFFDFCRRGLHPGGYLMHKYRADNSLGSSWHPYVHDGVSAPPIQEDETALVLFVFAQFYHLHQSTVKLREYYDSFIAPMATFLASYVDEATGLPKPSYDLWEEVFLTTTYTTATVVAALQSAAELAEEMEDADNAVKWRTAGEDIRAAAHKYLYNRERNCFYKGLRVKDGVVTYDGTVDTSAVFGALLFGLFPVDSDEIRASVRTVETVFGVREGSWGIGRYENDTYRRTSDESIGNYWFIASLWLAQYYLETNERDKALQIVEWVKFRGLSTGMLAEQLNPATDEVISPAPLTWSHAEYMSILLDMIAEEA